MTTLITAAKETSKASDSVLFRSKGRAKNGASKPLSFFASRFISRAAKTENLLPRSFFAPKQHGNTCYAGYSDDVNTYDNARITVTISFLEQGNVSVLHVRHAL